MPRFLSPVARLIAAVLLLQVLLAPAHCLAMVAAPAGLETVVCAPDGMRTIHVGPDGQEMPAHEASQGFCLACHGLPQAMMPDAPRVTGPAWIATLVTWHAAQAKTLPPAARAPPYRPTGPPTLS
ncbi:hypothetical protein GXW74_09915 [Roseomonas eburnea]|uniref:DUF2946 domain-containing protein n=1 Tax=Neoroseomonas eburnea TaxID=1346889 RepID=A0A9X9XAR7_9PROT|nr:hypothetical protein [Neoroseomonas eburnea]MBR0680803.1 hypothetical protein [Neoroseomonas eburnea]